MDMTTFFDNVKKNLGKLLSVTVLGTVIAGVSLYYQFNSDSKQERYLAAKEAKEYIQRTRSEISKVDGERKKFLILAELCQTLNKDGREYNCANLYYELNKQAGFDVTFYQKLDSIHDETIVEMNKYIVPYVKSEEDKQLVNSIFDKLNKIKGLNEVSNDEFIQITNSLVEMINEMNKLYAYVYKNLTEDFL